MHLVKNTVSVSARAFLSQLTLPLRRGKGIEPGMLKRREIRPITYQINPDVAGTYIRRVVRVEDLPKLRSGSFPAGIAERGTKDLNIKSVSLLEVLEACDQLIPEELDFVVDSPSTRKALLQFLNPLFATTDAKNCRTLFNAWDGSLSITFKFLDQEAKRALFKVLDGEERETLFRFFLDYGSVQEQTDFAQIVYELDQPMYDALLRPWLTMEEC